ncbi:MAG: hypothetical protein NTV23_02630 [Propionibacteriales bacterium]|nr:hypothetical protein [Propionibacteriales bacterium]
MKQGAVGRAAAPVALVALAALALAPVLVSRGYVLIGDMSFVPSQPPKAAWLGLDGSVPRAVPADAVVSALSHLAPGDLVQKALLLAALVLAGLGMRSLVASLLGPGAQLASLGAGVLYLWNPWVLERLAIGHWGLLLGYAALPWVAQTALRFRAGPDAVTLAALVLPLALASAGSPTGGILAGLVALALAGRRAATRPLLAVTGTVVLVNLPWLLPGLLGDAEPTAVSGVDAFAARSDSPLGVVGSVLSLGGIWKSATVPGERDSFLLVLLAVALSLAALVQLVRVARRGPRHAEPSFALPLLLLAGTGLVLALLPTFGAGHDLVTWLVRNVPGAGILRDSQKWSALLALAVSVGFGMALDAGGTALRRRGRPARGVVVGAALLPVVLLPSLAWGIAGKLEPVHYPSDWSQVRAVLEDQPAASRRTVALPFSAYQSYPWNDGRAALDPALRFLPGDVITNDTLVVGPGIVVAGEDPIAARIASAVSSRSDLGPVLARDGVRYVLLERTAAGAASVDAAPLVAAGEVLVDGPELMLVDLGAGAVSAVPASAVVIVGADVIAFGTVLLALFLTLRQIGGKKDKTG